MTSKNYIAAQSAAVHDSHIKAYVDGLRARGKPYKCAIVAKKSTESTCMKTQLLRDLQRP